MILPVMQTFSTHKNDSEIVQLVYVKSGTLILQGCNLSIESNQLSRARCVYQAQGTSCFISHCSFKGGGNSKPPTAAIDTLRGNLCVQNCNFNNFRSGGVMADLTRDNRFLLKDNAFISCSKNSVYVQGEGSQPLIIKNVFMVCKGTTIIINSQADAFICLNQMQINETAIELVNNKSILYANTIQKSHHDGVKCVCTADLFTKDNHTEPIIQKNYIEASTHSGIVCEGEYCDPKIRENIIETNRKAGIKLMNKAKAHIGGESPDDIDRHKTKHNFQDLEFHLEKCIEEK